MRFPLGLMALVLLLTAPLSLPLPTAAQALKERKTSRPRGGTKSPLHFTPKQEVEHWLCLYHTFQ